MNQVYKNVCFDQSSIFYEFNGFQIINHNNRFVFRETNYYL